MSVVMDWSARVLEQPTANTIAINAITSPAPYLRFESSLFHYTQSSVTQYDATIGDKAVSRFWAVCAVRQLVLTREPVRDLKIFIPSGRLLSIALPLEFGWT